MGIPVVLAAVVNEIFSSSPYLAGLDVQVGVGKIVVPLTVPEPEAYRVEFPVVGREDIVDRMVRNR